MILRLITDKAPPWLKPANIPRSFATMSFTKSCRRRARTKIAGARVSDFDNTEKKMPASKIFY